MSLFYEENRLAKIINILEQKRTVTVTYLSEKMEVSYKTIKNDIKEINNILNGCALIDYGKNEYTFYIFDKKVYNDVKSKIFEQNDFMNSPGMRMAFIIQKLMNSNTPYLTEELAYDMNVGRSTVNGDLKKLRFLIEEYGLEIEGKTNTGIYLKGDEINIRFFILENMYEPIYREYPLDEDILNIVHRLAKKYFLDSITVDYFKRSFILMIDRFMNGYKIEELSGVYNDLKDTQAYRFANEVSKEVRKYILTDIPENEIKFIAIPIAGMRTPTNEKGIESIKVGSDVITLIETMISEIKREMNIDIEQNELMEDFVYHISFMMNRLKYGMRIRGIDCEDIKRNNTVSYKMAEFAADIVTKETGYNLSKEEIALMAVYFDIFIDKSKKNNICNIAIVCGTGRVTARVIENQLRKIIKEDILIDIYSDSEITSKNIEKYDVVVSNVKLNIESEKKIIYLREIFNENELKRKLELLNYEERIELSQVEGIDSLVVRMLNEDRFFILDGKYGYSENLNMMIDILTEEGMLDIGFKERIRLREEKSTMIFDRHIAFPHTINYGSDKAVVALGVFSGPINDDMGRNVKLVFLLGLPKDNKDDTILVKLYDEIISIASDIEAISRISKVKNYKELLIYFAQRSTIKKNIN